MSRGTVRVRANARIESLDWGEVGDLPIDIRTQAWIDAGIVSVLPDQEVVLDRDIEPSHPAAPAGDVTPADVVGVDKTIGQEGEPPVRAPRARRSDG